jgi:hypothetical protein
MERKELILYLIDKISKTELEITTHTTNYDYGLLSLESNGRKIYFEFDDSKQIDLIIDRLKEVQTHLIEIDKEV